MKLKALSGSLLGIALIMSSGGATAQGFKMEPHLAFGEGGVLEHKGISSYMKGLEATDSVGRADHSRERRITYRFGVYLSRSFGEGVSVRSGLHFRSMGWRDHFELDLQEGGSTKNPKEIRSDAKVRIGELILPLLIRYQKETDKLFFFGSAGMELPFRVQRSLSYQEEVTSSSGGQLPGPAPGGGSKVENSEWGVKLDGLPVLAPTISGEFGGGFKLGKGRLGITFRMSTGFGAPFYTSDEALHRQAALPSGVYTKKGQERIERGHGISFDKLRFGSWSIGIGYRFSL